jgi:hypothetical protein
MSSLADQKADKVVTFFNAAMENVVPYAGKILEPPNSVPIQIIKTTDDGMMATHIIDATERRSNVGRVSSQVENSLAYAEAFSISRTFVITDSYFSEDSMLVDSENFLKHGLEPLKHFYETGGRVVVVCKEGIYAIGSKLAPHFGCQWRLGKINDEKCVPSEKARAFFGTLLPNELYIRKGHFMVAPEDERLYTATILSEEEYFTDNYSGFSSDEDLDTEEVSEAKKYYSQYVNENSSSALLALHEHESGGSLVWMGDQAETDSNVRALFAKLCCGEV